MTFEVTYHLLIANRECTSPEEVKMREHLKPLLKRFFDEGYAERGVEDRGWQVVLDCVTGER